MGNQKIRVAMITNHFGITGIATVIMNYCKALDKSKYDLTIIAGKPIAEQYEKECKKFDITLIRLPSRQKEPKAHYMCLWKKLREGRYDIVHDHGNSSMMAIELTIAKFAGIKNRIAHSHNSTCPNIKVHKFLNPYFNKIYTKALACGKLAGDWLFGENNFEILPNCFQTDDFEFSQKVRNEIRKEINLENKFIIGHIGRINEQKNQEYLLKIFEKVALKSDDTFLLIVGNGPDSEKIKKKVSMHPFKNRIILYGETNNPAAFYSAMDVFVFPSRFEGLPVVLLEAQISGLPCVVSDKVTREVDFGDINWLSIEGDAQQWADVIIKIKENIDVDRASYKIIHTKQIHKYDIGHASILLDNIYTKMMKNNN